MESVPSENRRIGIPDYQQLGIPAGQLHHGVDAARWNASFCAAAFSYCPR
jgi:hypothetical protein